MDFATKQNYLDTTLLHLLYYQCHPIYFVCVNNFKSACTFLTALTRLADILVVLRETKHTVREIPADCTFVLMLMGSPSRTLDRLEGRE